MDSINNYLLIIFFVFLLRFGLFNWIDNIQHAIDHWLTIKVGMKSFEKRASKQGFLDLYLRELELRSYRPMTQIECHYAFRAASNKFKQNIT